MRLDGWPAELILGLVLAALLGVAVWRWRRFRFLRSSRFAVLLAAQLLVVSLGFVGINIAGQFFDSWGDVVGSTAGVGVEQGLVRVAPETAAPGIPNDWRVSATERALDERDAYASQVSTLTVSGPETGYALPAEIYLPGSYAADPHRTYPVLELIPGYPGSRTGWVKYLHLQSTLDGLIASGAIPAVIAVSVTPHPRHGHDSECVDADPGQVPGSLADSYLSKDVPDYLERHFRVGRDRADWVLGGFSTGGFCAANLALRHATEFGAAISLSGYFEPIVDNTTGPLYANQAQRDSNNPMRLVRLPHPTLAFFLGAARNQPDDMAQLRRFAARVPRTDAIDVSTTSSGGHSASTWKRLIPIAFTRIATMLER